MGRSDSPSGSPLRYTYCTTFTLAMQARDWDFHRPRTMYYRNADARERWCRRETSGGSLSIIGGSLPSFRLAGGQQAVLFGEFRRDLDRIGDIVAVVAAALVVEIFRYADEEGAHRVVVEVEIVAAQVGVRGRSSRGTARTTPFRLWSRRSGSRNIRSRWFPTRSSWAVPP